MSKGLNVMKANVGKLLGDETGDFASRIEIWLNDGYRDIARRCQWSDLIDDNFTFVSSTDVAEYVLCSTNSNFDEEIFVADITNGHELERYPEGKWWKDRAADYAAGSLTSGNPVRYVILEEANKIKLDPPAEIGGETYAMPYKMSITVLSSTSDTTAIRDIETIMEQYALSEGNAFQNEFGKATYYRGRYEEELRKRIGQERSKVNQLYQSIPESYGATRIKRLTGDASYDSL